LVFKLQSKMSGMFFLRHSVYIYLLCIIKVWRRQRRRRWWCVFCA